MGHPKGFLATNTCFLLNQGSQDECAIRPPVRLLLAGRRESGVCGHLLKDTEVFKV